MDERVPETNELGFVEVVHDDGFVWVSLSTANSCGIGFPRTAQCQGILKMEVLALFNTQ